MCRQLLMPIFIYLQSQQHNSFWIQVIGSFSEFFLTKCNVDSSSAYSMHHPSCFLLIKRWLILDILYHMNCGRHYPNIMQILVAGVHHARMDTEMFKVLHTEPMGHYPYILLFNFLQQSSWLNITLLWYTKAGVFQILARGSKPYQRLDSVFITSSKSH